MSINVFNRLCAAVIKGKLSGSTRRLSEFASVLTAV